MRKLLALFYGLIIDQTGLIFQLYDLKSDTISSFHLVFIYIHLLLVAKTREAVFSTRTWHRISCFKGFVFLSSVSSLFFNCVTSFKWWANIIKLCAQPCWICSTAECRQTEPRWTKRSRSCYRRRGRVQCFPGDSAICLVVSYVFPDRSTYIWCWMFNTHCGLRQTALKCVNGGAKLLLLV